MEYRNRLSESRIPPVIFGTSALGNLFVALDDSTKKAIVSECIAHTKGQVVFDTAGKYGAGLALEVLGKSLKELGIKPDQVIISNKLGWYRTPLLTEEPTFEPGVWKNIAHDAAQRISYNGIMECFAQGNELLNGYSPQWLSVHDPDEYLARATDADEEQLFYEDILAAYRALEELKARGLVTAIGVGAKDWRIIQRIASDIQLDWVMFANSLTIYHHPQQLIDFVKDLHDKGTYVINSAVFHSGFLIGSNYFDYNLIQPDMPKHKQLFEWREDFFDICKQFGVKPADACVQYALNIPGVSSIALSTTAVDRIQQNIAIAEKEVPAGFWDALLAKGLISTPFSMSLT